MFRLDVMSYLLCNVLLAKHFANGRSFPHGRSICLFSIGNHPLTFLHHWLHLLIQCLQVSFRLILNCKFFRKLAKSFGIRLCWFSFASGWCCWIEIVEEWGRAEPSSCLLSSFRKLAKKMKAKFEKIFHLFEEMEKAGQAAGWQKFAAFRRRQKWPCA